MLGWDIFVTGIDKQGKKVTVASWSASVFGCSWLNELVKQGVAKGIPGNGYPNRYELPLSVLLDKIIPTPPDGDSPLVIGDDYVRESKSSSFKFHENVVLDIDAHTVVEVEAWDQS
jgi:hypothetical protein